MMPLVQTEILVALIGAAGVAGTIGGSIVGARLQAGGGHAQAEAARAAADTAASAAWRQSMRDLRWTVLSAYLRAASEAQEVDEELHRAGAAETAEAAKQTFHAYRLAHAEAELVAPDDVQAALALMDSEIRSSHKAAVRRASAIRSIRKLEELASGGNREAIHAWFGIEHAIEGPGARAERVGGARDALRVVDGLSADDVGHLSAIMAFGEELESVFRFRDTVEGTSARYAEARGELVTAIRTALGTSA